MNSAHGTITADLAEITRGVDSGDIGVIRYGQEVKSVEQDSYSSIEIWSLEVEYYYLRRRPRRERSQEEFLLWLEGGS